MQKSAYQAHNVEFALADRKSGDIIGAELTGEASEIMTDITEFERRISAALGRISEGLNQIETAPPPDPVDDSEMIALRDALEEERTANAQLEERVKSIHEQQEQQESAVASLTADLATARDQASQNATDAQRLESVNAQLRADNQALRAANETGVGDPDLINKAMTTELDSLRLSRDADRTELDMILSELKPLVEGTADA